MPLRPRSLLRRLGSPQRHNFRAWFRLEGRSRGPKKTALNGENRPFSGPDRGLNGGPAADPPAIAKCLQGKENGAYRGGEGGYNGRGW